jgi:hypothetical protein
MKTIKTAENLLIHTQIQTSVHDTRCLTPTVDERQVGTKQKDMNMHDWKNGKARHKMKSAQFGLANQNKVDKLEETFSWTGEMAQLSASLGDGVGDQIVDSMHKSDIQRKQANDMVENVIWKNMRSKNERQTQKRQNLKDSVNALVDVQLYRNMQKRSPCMTRLGLPMQDNCAHTQDLCTDRSTVLVAVVDEGDHLAASTPSAMNNRPITSHIDNHCAPKIRPGLEESEPCPLESSRGIQTEHSENTHMFLDVDNAQLRVNLLAREMECAHVVEDSMQSRTLLEGICRRILDANPYKKSLSNWDFNVALAHAQTLVGNAISIRDMARVLTGVQLRPVIPKQTEDRTYNSKKVAAHTELLDALGTLLRIKNSFVETADTASGVVQTGPNVSSVTRRNEIINSPEGHNALRLMCLGMWSGKKSKHVSQEEARTGFTPFTLEEGIECTRQRVSALAVKMQRFINNAKTKATTIEADGESCSTKYPRMVFDRFDQATGWLAKKTEPDNNDLQFQKTRVTECGVVLNTSVGAQTVRPTEHVHLHTTSNLSKQDSYPDGDRATGGEHLLSEGDRRWEREGTFHRTHRLCIPILNKGERPFINHTPVIIHAARKLLEAACVDMECKSMGAWTPDHSARRVGIIFPLMYYCIVALPGTFHQLQQGGERAINNNATKVSRAIQTTYESVDARSRLDGALRSALQDDAQTVVPGANRQGLIVKALRDHVAEHAGKYLAPMIRMGREPKVQTGLVNGPGCIAAHWIVCMFGTLATVYNDGQPVTGQSTVNSATLAVRTELQQLVALLEGVSSEKTNLTAWRHGLFAKDEACMHHMVSICMVLGCNPMDVFQLEFHGVDAQRQHSISQQYINLCFGAYHAGSAGGCVSDVGTKRASSSGRKQTEHKPSNRHTIHGLRKHPVYPIGSWYPLHPVIPKLGAYVDWFHTQTNSQS